MERRIREFRSGDLAGLEQMYRSFEPRGAAKGLPPVKDESIKQWLDHLDAHAHGFVAFDDAAGLRISGHAVLAESAGGAAELALFVHQDFRGRGVGTALVEAAVAGARRHGFRRLWLTVSTENRPALRVYEKCGFRVIPGGSSTDHEMELRLE